MKKIKTFEGFLNESKAYPSFYSSNYDKYIKPQRKGWYVGYRTKSGDTDFVMVDREPIDKLDAKRILQEINPHENYSFVTNIVEVEQDGPWKEESMKIMNQEYDNIQDVIDDMYDVVELGQEEFAKHNILPKPTGTIADIKDFLLKYDY
jgi:hypothetical protein